MDMVAVHSSRLPAEDECDIFIAYLILLEVEKRVLVHQPHSGALSLPTFSGVPLSMPYI